MFTFLSRFRRQTAVLTALALVASVLVAVPATAADDPPKADYKATFSACVGAAAEDAGFTDVPEGHTNAGDIDCIAYYGVTKGTSASTYSPLMSVTREHMALFLTRLAGLVGIEMVSDPDDPGFTDTGDLSDESQTAIAQLADLGITQGTSDTTYSPSDSVRRDHMALFIKRLMNKMTPIGGADSDWGHTPSDVNDTDQVASEDVGSPYTDLGSTTKTAFDAITELYELGVVSGISETAYAPSALITRAAMAEFMAAVMGHSNLRPAGLTIQASNPSGFGDVSGNVVVSVRDDSFAPVEDQAVDHFNSAAANAGLKRGACDLETAGVVDGDCTWNDTDDFTGSDGNLVLDGNADEGMTHVYYAWIGDEDGDEFDANTVNYASTSVVSSKDEEALKVTSTINKEATANRVDLDKVKSVTVTVQLVDTANDAGATTRGPAANAKAVARSGQSITVGLTQRSNPTGALEDPTGTADFASSKVATLTTDDDGKVTYTMDAPEDDDDKNDEHSSDVTDATTDPPTLRGVNGNLEDRIDILEFTYVTTAGVNDGTPEVATVTFTIRWSETNPVVTKAKASADDYVILESDGDAKVSATVTFYDQYGNGIRVASGQKVGIEFGEGETDADGDPIDPVANVNSNGVARRGTILKSQAGGAPIAVAYTVDPDESGTGTDPIDVPETVTLTNGSIQVVTEANQDDTGPRNVHTMFADDDQFTTEASDTDTDANKLYSYDSNDTFIMGGETITMDKFEEALATQFDDSGNPVANAAVLNVVSYNPDGASIFVVTTSSS